MRIESRQQLIECREQFKKALECQYKQVVICGGSGCVAGGSLNVYDRMKQLMEERGLKVDVVLQHETHDESVGLKHSGCHGFCQMGPLMRIEPMGLLYIKVTVDDCEEIIEKTILNDEVIDRLVYHEDGESYVRQEDIPFYKQQTRVALEHCGHINAESVEEYIAVGGYTALEKALFDMTPDEIIAEVSDSGLRGRGGAGFPTGKKWAQVAAHKDAPVKYIVCNGDEGDPGAFMDRSIMEGDPHRMIEGMIIAGIATGSEEGYIYVRAEYPLAVERLKMAIADDEAHGILGENILGSGKNFRLHINRGAGAFVCGEGSALTASIEGERGMPRTKPPRSVDRGLFDAPTSLNNVETFANVPPIIERGSAWYRGIGTETSTGTKAFALTGNIKHTGLIEVPMGTTLREIVFDIGGGVKNGKFKAVQIGGPSGGCLTEEHLDLPLDFESTKKIGAIIGSGGLVVMGDDTCMVEIARFFMNFTKKESCGKCATCREGIPKIQAILERITHGSGTIEDIDMLQELSSVVKTCSLCGLGKTATNPVLSTLKYFKDEYIAHIVDKKCPAGACRSLCTMWIDPLKCIGCTKCARNCPVGAITGELRKPHKIDPEKCIKCRECKNGCPKHAIKEV
ncbi:putative iron hydrogenase electron-transfer subunit [Firmicutes bacterium CAG:240]|jgi:NADH-quinone oxidoreductase subunit F|nr:putative iron hydrogenase electron-transfer subunit [Firmicutes bacterium CAG:240]HCY79856.1 NADH-quinone oxidoreductase subunit NuoF [Clostridiales bacterium]